MSIRHNMCQHNFWIVLENERVPKDQLRQISYDRAAQEFLELFFPIHYTVGMRVEETFCSGVLSRQQAIILWLIRSQGDNGKTMDRKEIEQVMAEWYEITSSAISKAIRSLAKPPLSLLTIEEHPASGREKRVVLTTKGEKFVAQMNENGRALIERATDQMTPDEIAMGIYMFKRISEIFASTPELARRRDGKGRAG